MTRRWSLTEVPFCYGHRSGLGCPMVPDRLRDGTYGPSYLVRAQALISQNPGLARPDLSSPTAGPRGSDNGHFLFDPLAGFAKHWPCGFRLQVFNRMTSIWKNFARVVLWSGTTSTECVCWRIQLRQRGRWGTARTAITRTSPARNVSA